MLPPVDRAVHRDDHGHGKHDSRDGASEQNQQSYRVRFRLNRLLSP